MPGVDVTTATRSGPSAPVLAPSGQAFFAGMADRGPTDEAVTIHGLADFEAWFGTRVSYSHLHDTVRIFFEEGGSQAHVVRVVGPSATKGQIILDDRAGSPADTVKFVAASAGAWSGNLDVVVADGTVSNSVTISLMLDDVQVESHANLTSPAAIVAAFAASKFVDVTDLGSVTAAPNNNPAAGTFSLSSGTDDRSNATATEYEDALDTFGSALGTGAVSIPGVGTTVHQKIIDHCVANNRVGILSMAEDDEVSDLTTQAGLLNSEYAGLFAPWLKVTATTATTRNVPPDGLVAATRNRAHVETGPWRAGAGQIGVSQSRSVVGLVADYGRADGETLDTGKVSAIRAISNVIRVYGWRSLSNDVDNYKYLTSRDLLNALVYEAEQRLEQYVYLPIDAKGHLLSSVQGTLVGILEPIRQKGGVFEWRNAAGDLLDPGYLVETGSNVNSLEQMANDIIKAQVSVRMAPSAALISVTIIKVGLLSNL